MPHRCVHCSKSYEDGSREILHGCECGSKFFFYVSSDKLAKIKQAENGVILSEEEKSQVEQDVRDMMGLKENDDTPIVLDFESVKVLKPGKYALDLHNLFNKERPLVYTLEEGKYFVDLNSQM